VSSELRLFQSPIISLHEPQHLQHQAEEVLRRQEFS